MDELFSDSDTFIKERPTKLSEKHKKKLYRELAQEIIDNRWSYEDVSIIAKDLKELSLSDSGYEKAKHLEKWCRGRYKVDMEFVNWLDSISTEFDMAKHTLAKRWVKAHNIQPLYAVGAMLCIQSLLFVFKEDGYRIGNIIYVNGYRMEEGLYCVSPNLGDTTNMLFTYEKIEECCIDCCVYAKLEE